MRYKTIKITNLNCFCFTKLPLKKNHSTTVSLVILVVLEWSYNLSLFWIIMNSAHFSCAVLPAWSLAHSRCDDIPKSGNHLLRDMGGLWITKHQLWCNFQAKTQRKRHYLYTFMLESIWNSAVIAKCLLSQTIQIYRDGYNGIMLCFNHRLTYT